MEEGAGPGGSLGSSAPSLSGRGSSGRVAARMRGLLSPGPRSTPRAEPQPACGRREVRLAGAGCGSSPVTSGDQWEGRTGPPAPPPSLALRTLKASRQPWLLLRIYKSGFCLRVARAAAQLEPRAVLPLAPPGGGTEPCSQGRLARRCPPSPPKCLGREIAASDLVGNPEIVSSFVPFATCDPDESKLCRKFAVPHLKNGVERLRYDNVCTNAF